MLQIEVKYLAEVLGVKPGAARMQVYRAKSKMHAKGVVIEGVDLAQAAAVAEKTDASWGKGENGKSDEGAGGKRKAKKQEKEKEDKPKVKKIKKEDSATAED